MYTTPAPTEAQRSSARATLERLHSAPDAPVELPSELRGMFEVLLSETAQGHALAVLKLEDTLTTQQAADVLGVSRPTLIGLLEEGQIPFHKVGTHRRVRLEDVLFFRAENNRRRLEIPAELSAQAQELKMGY